MHERLRRLFYISQLMPSRYSIPAGHKQIDSMLGPDNHVAEVTTKIVKHPKMNWIPTDSLNENQEHEVHNIQSMRQVQLPREDEETECLQEEIQSQGWWQA